MIGLNSEYQQNPFDYFELEPNPPVTVGPPQENRLSSDINIGAYVTRNDVNPYDANGNNQPHHIVNTGKAFFNYGVVGGVALPTEQISRLVTHEISHFSDIANTHDVFYDYNDGRSIYGKNPNNLNDTKYTPALVTNRPELAIQHADAFSYYIEAPK